MTKAATTSSSISIMMSSALEKNSSTASGSVPNNKSMPTIAALIKTNAKATPGKFILFISNLIRLSMRIASLYELQEIIFERLLFIIERTDFDLASDHRLYNVILFVFFIVNMNDISIFFHMRVQRH